MEVIKRLISYRQRGYQLHTNATPQLNHVRVGVKQPVVWWNYTAFLMRTWAEHFLTYTGSENILSVEITLVDIVKRNHVGEM